MDRYYRRTLHPIRYTQNKNRCCLFQAANRRCAAHYLVLKYAVWLFFLFSSQKRRNFFKNVQKKRQKLLPNTSFKCSAVVVWFVKASVFHSVNSAPSRNGGSNPTWECCMDLPNSKEFVATQIARRRVLFGGFTIQAPGVSC